MMNGEHFDRPCGRFQPQTELLNRASPGGAIPTLLAKSVVPEFQIYIEWAG
jgi:hypothetical protein